MAAASALDFTQTKRWPNASSIIKRDATGTITNIVPLDCTKFDLTTAQAAGEVVTLNPGAGWRACGSIQRYAEELVWADAWYKAWNAANGGALLNVCLFTTGGWGWDEFDLQGSNLDVVTAALAAAL
jgi:hypothetical protein